MALPAGWRISRTRRGACRDQVADPMIKVNGAIADSNKIRTSATWQALGLVVPIEWDCLAYERDSKLLATPHDALLC